MTNPEDLKTAEPATKAAVVPRLTIFLITLLWAVPLLLLLLNAQFKMVVIEHQTYVAWRAILIFILLGLGIWGLLRSFDLLKAHAGDPWYTDPLLVSLVLFWGLFPPMWFFVEYLSFDRGSFALPLVVPKEIQAAQANADPAAVENLRSDFLARTKLYADMASKVWFAVGAALGAVISLTRR
jgi:hypothetical protein